MFRTDANEVSNEIITKHERNAAVRIVGRGFFKDLPPLWHLSLPERA
jgi:hypothetical protein